MHKKTYYILIALTLIIATVVIILFNKKNSVGSLIGLPTNEFTKDVVFIDGKDIKVHFSKWFAPYQTNGKKTNYPDITNKYGVYFIRNKRTQEIVYIGFSSSNLYKALYRHFQYYNDNNKQVRVYYTDRDKYEVLIMVCAQKYASKLEKHYIYEYAPKDCTHKYDYYFNQEPENNLIEPNDFDFWEDTKNFNQTAPF